MGYTHYFTFKAERGRARELELTYKAALLECQRIAKRYYAERGRLAGYSAHTPIGHYGGLQVNGKGIESCESFELPEHFRDAVAMGFSFCKTNGNPYDLVVTACLAVLKYRLGNAISISSDGHAPDWTSGVNFARRVTRRAIPNPIGKRVALIKAETVSVAAV